jgi:sulfane dehydrogenase subunit SoxC
MPQNRTPSFAAPMDPVGYFRRLVHEPHETVARLTRQQDLFVLAHLGIPRVDLAQWRLDIAGLVKRPATLNFEDLRRLPERQIESFHQCAGAPRRPDLPTRRVGNVVWHGVDLAELLQQRGISDGARFLWAYGLDHGEYDGVAAEWYVKDMPLARLEQGGVLLAYAVNGEPLTAEHGFPLRLGSIRCNTQVRFSAAPGDHYLQIGQMLFKSQRCYFVLEPTRTRHFQT